jgi:hypothetical protein
VDTEAIEEIKREFHTQMNHSPLPQKDIQSGGRELYPEHSN